MTPEEIRYAVLEILGAIAPDADLGTIDPGTDLQQQLDLDSFDFLNVMVGLSERLEVEVPEQDYADLATLDDCVSYLGRRLKASTVR